MYTLLIAIGSGALISAISSLFLGVVASVLPGVIVLVVVYFMLARSIGKQMEAKMLFVQSEFQKQRFEHGLKLLQDIKKQYGNWQFFTKSSIDGQIGSVYYMRQDFAKAKPFLENSFSRHWVAKAMLAVLHYRKKEYAQMDKVFEQATGFSGKQGLLWSLWAYCHSRLGHHEKAISILLQGKKKLGTKIQSSMLIYWVCKMKRK